MFKILGSELTSGLVKFDNLGVTADTIWKAVTARFSFLEHIIISNEYGCREKYSKLLM
jgi:hypothetical protein